MWVIMSLVWVQDLSWSSTLPLGSAVNTGLNPLKVSRVSGVRMAGAAGPGMCVINHPSVPTAKHVHVLAELFTGPSPSSVKRLDIR